MTASKPIPASPLWRWKLACALLAGLAGYSMTHRAAPDTPAPPAISRRATLAGLRAPLRISPEAAGVSRDELVDQALHARTGAELRLITDRLGIVGNDDTVDQLAPLLADLRPGFASDVLECYAAIGTEHAVARLIERVFDDRMDVRQSAITELGSTHSAEAERLLLALARKSGDPMQTWAISALGELGSDAAVAELVALSSSPSIDIAGDAVTTLGAAHTEAATTALHALIESPDPRVAAFALLAIDDIDDALLAQLTRLVQSGNADVRNTALSVLPHAGERALPVLRVAALTGQVDQRKAATTAIGELGSPAAIRLLGEIVETGDRASASAATAALAKHGGKAAREILIGAALGERAQMSGAVGELVKLDGEDVEQALLVVLKSGAIADRRAVLPRLIQGGNADAVDLALELVRNGARSEKTAVVRVLVDAGVPHAIDALIDLAGKLHGKDREAVLDRLALGRPADPGVQRLLHDALFSGRSDDAEQAALLLGQIGSREARAMLISALDKDKKLASVAARALGDLGVDDTVKRAMMSAAQRDPSLAGDVAARLLQAGAPEGLRLAAQVFDGDDVDAARSVISALAAAGTPEARQLIDRQLDAKDQRVRLAAVASLVENPDDRSTEALIRLTRDAEPDVRAEAMSSLGQLGTEHAEAALFDAVRAGDSLDRAHAAEGLAAIGDPRAGAQIAQLIRDADPQVVEAAIDAAHNFGAEVDAPLLAIARDPNANDRLKSRAVAQLRKRGNLEIATLVPSPETEEFEAGTSTDTDSD